MLEPVLQRDDAIILLHGDHGNRIFEEDLRSTRTRVTSDELRGGFATLFAMRIPGVPPRTYEKQATVASLLRNWDFKSYPEGETDTVFLDDEKWHPTTELAMPLPGAHDVIEIEPAGEEQAASWN